MRQEQRGSTRRPSSRGVNYVRGARTQSARGYVAVGGELYAIPHGRRRPQSQPQARTFQGRTEYAAQFANHPYCFSSMDRKPLAPYSPSAFRSRNATDDPPMPYKNSSLISFGKDDKHRFVTTNQRFFRGEQCDLRSNQGILSDASRRAHTQQRR
mmetsp:Transcript_53837/g.128249  ORF Transcript_53837/g.128249 Transcript_53837/m.128249 type:complete len:155 (+) Transcript_53837:77-541(+)